MDGSYVIKYFTDDMIKNIKENDNKNWLYQIFDKLENDLHQEGKQKMENTFRDQTRFIKFKPINNGILDELNGKDNIEWNTGKQKSMSNGYISIEGQTDGNLDFVTDTEITTNAIMVSDELEMEKLKNEKIGN